MKKHFVRMLACHKCLSDVEIKSIKEEKADGEEVVEGTLHCNKCGEIFPIKSGIPVFLKPEDYASHVADSFGFEWQLHHDGGFESDTVFGHTLDEDIENFFESFAIDPEEIKNKVIIDAGCGSGTLTVEIAKRYPETTIIGLDFNPAIEEVYKKYSHLNNLHLVRASVFNIPFNNETFDYAWSNGVIHHTGDTRAAFNSVTRTTKEGGKAYLWVYQKKFSPMVALRNLLIPFGVVHWNHKTLYRFCQLVSIPTWSIVKILSALGKKGVSKEHPHLRIYTRSRGFNELVLTWFDVLSPKYRDTYSQKEFANWFHENGFTDIKYYWWPTGIVGTYKGNR